MVGREGRERVGKRQPIRQKFVGGIEAAPPDHVLIDVPANPLGGTGCNCKLSVPGQPSRKCFLCPPNRCRGICTPLVGSSMKRKVDTAPGRDTAAERVADWRQIKFG